MRASDRVEPWVVYEAVQGPDIGRRSVCLQSEWEAIELRHPGANRVIQRDITSETEAEILARGTSGDVKPRGSSKRQT